MKNLLCKIKHILGLIVTVLALGLLIVFVFLIMVKLFGGGSNDEYEMKEAHKYQSLTYNPVSKELSFGMVSIYEEIDVEQEYISHFVNDVGNYVLISDFGAEEYQCEGLCYCSQGHRRSSASHAIRKPVTYLVAASTALVASTAAKRYFEETCHDELSEQCDSSSIVSELVDGQCYSVTEEEAGLGDDTLPLGEVVEKLEGGASDDEDKEVEYVCEGYCYPTVPEFRSFVTHPTFITDIYYMFRKSGANDAFDTVTAKLDKCQQITLDGVEVRLDVPSEDSNPQSLLKAKKKFLEDHLEPICLSGGAMTHEDENTVYYARSRLNSEVDDYRAEKITQMFDHILLDKDGLKSYCSGHYHPNADLKNVKCRKKRSAKPVPEPEPEPEPEPVPEPEPEPEPTPSIPEPEPIPTPEEEPIVAAPKATDEDSKPTPKPKKTTKKKTTKKKTPKKKKTKKKKE